MIKRPFDKIRPLSITPHYITHPEGSVLIAFGDTKVICTASIEERVPRWRKDTGKGWVTGQYDMLPRATSSRRDRDANRGKINGRTQEISRLIGRSLRAAVDLKKLGERSITVDCDVIQADGGTRTASITGGYVALAIALNGLVKAGKMKELPFKNNIVAVSAGIFKGEPVLDLDYHLDSNADVDLNVVMTGEGRIAEVQGTGEQITFDRNQLDAMLDLCLSAAPVLTDLQERALAVPFEERGVTITAQM